MPGPLVDNSLDIKVSTLPANSSRGRGRPSISAQLSRDRSHSTGSIHQYLKSALDSDKKRKGREGSSSPTDSLALVKPSKKINAGDSSPDPPVEALAALADLPTASVEVTPSPSMDNLIAEIRSMRHENSKQFDEMKAQLASAAQKHDAKLAELREELRSNKEESTRRYHELQKQIKSLEKNMRDENLALADRLQTVENQRTEQSNQPSAAADRNLDLLLNRVEFLEKETKKNNIVIKGLSVPRTNAMDTVERFLADEFGIERKIVEIRSLPPIRRMPAVVVKLDSWYTKQEILSNKTKLKGRDIFIDRDLTYLERQKAKELRVLAKQFKAEGHTVKLGYQGMEIDGINHVWNQKDKVLRKSERPSPTRAGSAAEAGGSGNTDIKN